jgi:hypothetical protein
MKIGGMNVLNKSSSALEENSTGSSVGDFPLVSGDISPKSLFVIQINFPRPLLKLLRGCDNLLLG